MRTRKSHHGSAGLSCIGLFFLTLLSACSTGPTVDDFRDQWRWFDAGAQPAEDAQRPWPGADWHATRQQDWQVRNGRVECLDVRPRIAGRTLALLTRTIEKPGEGGASISVVVEGVEESGGWRTGSHAGFLFGVGGSDVSWKRSALVQQAPAKDGGWLASLTSTGHIRISSFHDELDKSGYWTIATNVDFDSLPVAVESAEALPLDQGPIRLSLSWTPGASAQGRLVLEAVLVTEPEAKAQRISAVIASFALENIDGSISLFSAQGPKDSKKGFAFSDFRLHGGSRHDERAWGPILAVQYLVDRSEDAASGSALRLTAHMAAMGPDEASEGGLWLEDDEGNWKLAALGHRSSDGTDLIQFEVKGYRDRSDGQPRRYRVEYQSRFPWSADPTVAGAPSRSATSTTYAGTIRVEPKGDQPLVVASLSCLKNQVGPIQWNRMGLWFPHEELVSNVSRQDPDLLYFSGDQIYEGDLTGPDTRSLARSIADYETKYRRFLWAFGDLMRDRPSVLVPDDHDVFHGNLWGAGGKRATSSPGLTAQDSGGYKMPAEFVNVVHRSLTSTLPPPRIAAVIGMGVRTYTTSFSWGGVDFAVLSDRMWKSSPSTAAPEARFRNGWIQNPDFDPQDADGADAVLLGSEQERFLEVWAGEREEGIWTKVLLSQSPFSCLHSLPSGTKSDSVVGRQEPPRPGEYPLNDAPVADGDSNGWPQSGRHRAVALLARAGALHLAGDQHLGTVAWYGVDDWRDGTVAFTSPAMGNTWPRRWMPKNEGDRRPENESGQPLTPRYTGDYLDGFGNKVTVLAVANPEENGLEPRLMKNRAPGFGIVRFDPAAKAVTLEAWPLWDSESMFPDWPLVLDARARPLGPWRPSR